MDIIYYFISAVHNCTLLLCLVAIIYWLLKAGNTKQEMRLVILAGNRALLVAGSLFTLLWIGQLIDIFLLSGVEYEQYAIAPGSSPEEYEYYMWLNRLTGPYWWAYWSMVLSAGLFTQLLWFRKIRNSVLAAFIISLLVNSGMLFERIVIIITSLHRDYLPGSWSIYSPFRFDWLELLIYCAALATAYVFLKRKKAV